MFKGFSDAWYVVPDYVVIWKLYKCHQHNNIWLMFSVLKVLRSRQCYQRRARYSPLCYSSTYIDIITGFNRTTYEYRTLSQLNTLKFIPVRYIKTVTA
jgi:hypothetical protein